MTKEDNEVITLAHGGGGHEMASLISTFSFQRGRWKGHDDDAAYYEAAAGLTVFTTDSFVVDPIFFPGGDIGKLAACGSINDVAVMGADPVGLSIGLVLEEGLPISDLRKILASIDEISRRTGVPIATGDTKVMERGKLDKIIINTSCVGSAARIIDSAPSIGDHVIVSGSLGEHAVALLSRRFEFSTDIMSDAKPLLAEMQGLRDLVRCARDITRGGLAAVLNEMAMKHGIGVLLDEKSVPVKPQVRAATEMLGINVYELASEGRLVCFTSRPEEVLSILKPHDADATDIGCVTEGHDIKIQTSLGIRHLPMPRGRIVPRIC